MTEERRNKITRVLNQRQPHLIIVLENVDDPHNVAAVLRTADAVGVQNIYTIYTEREKPERYGKRASASALGWLTVHQFDSVEACMNQLKSEDFKILATHLGTHSKSLHEVDFTQKIAIVFGNERLGVSEECLSYCDGNFIIPQMGMVQSLNISVACAVTLYEAFRQKTLAGHYAQKQLSDREWNKLANEWNMID